MPDKITVLHTCISNIEADIQKWESILELETLPEVCEMLKRRIDNAKDKISDYQKELRIAQRRM